jgi:hypothetical protein
VPTIPLVNSPLPNAGGGTSNVRANPGLLDGVFNAQQRIGSAVASIGEQGTDLATRVKAATDTAYVIGAQTKLETTTQQFKAWTLEHPDTSTWGDELNTRMQHATEDVQAGAGNLGHGAKLHLTSQVGAWQQRTKAQAGIWQTEQSIHNAAGVGDEAINAAVANGDADAAHAVIETLVSHGVYSSAVGTAKAKRVTEAIVKNQANALITEDPTHAPELIRSKEHFPELNDTQREQLWREAMRSRNRVQTDNLDRMYRQHAAGAAWDPDEIKKSVEAGDLSARGAESFKSFIEREQKAATTADKARVTEQVKADAQELQNDIHEYDPAQDVTGSVYADIKQRARSLPMAYSEKLVSRLDAQKKKGMADASDDGMKMISQLHADGVFGDTKDEALKARSRAYDMQEQLIAWRKANPAATHQEERAFISENAYSYVVPHVVKLLREPAAKAENVTQDAYNALKSGERFFWSGEWHTKK